MKDILINERYRLDYKIGQGGFGLVYAGTDIQTGNQVAIKMMHQYEEGEVLETENEAHRALRGGPGMADVLWYGWQDDYCVLVQSMLGPSLEDLFNYCGRRFTIKTVLLLADQAICRLQHIHSKGFLHRDIKPDNFLMGVGRQGTTLYAIDFGLAVPHAEAQLTEPSKHVVGTRRYASLAAHNGEHQTWGSDLEALGYVLIYFALGRLPWQTAPSADDEEKTRLISHLKSTITITDLCAGLPSCFATYMTTVRALKFHQKPNYSHLRSLFRTEFTRSKLEYDYVFDWTAKRFAEIHGFHSRPQLPTPSPPFSSPTQKAPPRRRRKAAARNARRRVRGQNLAQAGGESIVQADGESVLQGVGAGPVRGDDVRHEAVQEALQEAVQEGIVRPEEVVQADNAGVTKMPSPSRAIARRGTKTPDKGPTRRLPRGNASRR